MSFSAAAAENFQFFWSLSGGCDEALGQSVAAAGKFQFFSLCRRRRLKLFQDFFEKILTFEKFSNKKGKNDN
jgi:hypothetical protein